LNPAPDTGDHNRGDDRAAALESVVARDADAIRHELLVLRCQREEDEAFAELVRHWERRLYYFIRRLVLREDDAEDVLQKTWMNVLRQIHRLNDPGAFRVWLFRIAGSTAISHGRREMAQASHHRREDQVAVNSTDRIGLRRSLSKGAGPGVVSFLFSPASTGLHDSRRRRPHPLRVSA
jgi:Sigma-70 region 2